ncbi:MAG: glycosyltransferase family 1 protein [Lachnospiraceae bacterium]|nr:glycosyltransferase family 1 protein [Lachnospiraceae bacterium]
MRKIRVLEVNINDIGQGGAWAFIKNAIMSKTTNETNIIFDFFTLEPFENRENVKFVEDHGGKVITRYTHNKVIRQGKTYIDLKNVLVNGNYDIVHIHSDVAFKMFTEGLAAKHAKVPHIIFHSHCSGIDRGHRIIKRIAHEICKPFLNLIGTDFFACSNKAGKWMYTKKTYKNIRVINNAIDCRKFQYDENIRKEYRNKLMLSNEIVIGHVGRFMYQKNHRFLIQIFNELQKIKKNVRLLLIGEGELENEIKQLVSKLELSDKVIFLGVTNEVAQYMQAMDLFLLPSFFEGLPVVGIEAQAAGLPCLMSSGITTETNLFGIVKFLSLQDDPKVWAMKTMKMIEKYKRRNTLDEMIKAGYDITTNKESLVDVYMKIIKGH